MHRTAQIPVNEPFEKNGRAKAKQNVREDRFCFCSSNVFEIRRGSGFRPAGGCGRNAGRAFWILAEKVSYVQSWVSGAKLEPV